MKFKKNNINNLRLITLSDKCFFNSIFVTIPSVNLLGSVCLSEMDLFSKISIFWTIVICLYESEIISLKCSGYS